MQEYTIYIEQDTFVNLEEYPNGISWSSGIRQNGEDIDGGSSGTFEEAKEILLNTLARLLKEPNRR